VYLPLILAFRAKERASQSANNTVTRLVAEESTAYTTSDGAHEAALTLLRIVGVGGVALVAVGVVGIAALWCTLAVLPDLLVLTVLSLLAVALLLVLAVLSLLAVALLLLAMLETAVLGRAVGGVLLVLLAVLGSWRSTVSLGCSLELKTCDDGGVQG